MVIKQKAKRPAWLKSPAEVAAAGLVQSPAQVESSFEAAAKEAAAKEAAAKEAAAKEAAAREKARVLKQEAAALKREVAVLKQERARVLEEEAAAQEEVAVLKQERETESSRSADAPESSIDPWLLGGVFVGVVAAFLLIDHFILPRWEEHQVAKAPSEEYYDDQAAAEQARFMQRQLLADKYRVM